MQRYPKCSNEHNFSFLGYPKQILDSFTDSFHTDLMKICDRMYYYSLICLQTLRQIWCLGNIFFNENLSHYFALDCIVSSLLLCSCVNIIFALGVKS